jgi:hypothetical protein
MECRQKLLCMLLILVQSNVCCLERIATFIKDRARAHRLKEMKPKMEQEKGLVVLGQLSGVPHEKKDDKGRLIDNKNSIADTVLEYVPELLWRYGMETPLFDELSCFGDCQTYAASWSPSGKKIALTCFSKIWWQQDIVNHFTGPQWCVYSTVFDAESEKRCGVAMYVCERSWCPDHHRCSLNWKNDSLLTCALDFGARYTYSFDWPMDSPLGTKIESTLDIKKETKDPIVVPLAPTPLLSTPLIIPVPDTVESKLESKEERTEKQALKKDDRGCIEGALLEGYRNSGRFKPKIAWAPDDSQCVRYSVHSFPWIARPEKKEVFYAACMHLARETEERERVRALQKKGSIEIALKK